MAKQDSFIPTRKSLLTRLKNWDDQEGWREFFETYWRLIYSVASKSGFTDAEAQDIVQDELDNIVGRDRAPTFDDYDALPQIQAFMLECLRWRPVTTLGFAHRSTADIPYKDFCIPKGAIVFGNHWAISRDPEVYPNPDKFNPQRWFGSDGRIRDDLKFPSFGFGRRICPGQHIANRSIFINTALLLWSFRITQDPNSPIDDTGFVDGVIAHPKPFDACFAPRIADEAHLRGVMAKYAEGL